MEYYKKWILKAIQDIFIQCKGIFVKNELYWRKIEGLGLEDEIIFGEIPDFIEIEENGVKYSISLIRGQKTGYFFDQRLNRKFLNSISQDASVMIDWFTNQGGFALNAAKGMRKELLVVDSDSAIEFANKNILLNSFKNIEFIVDDVFEIFEEAD